MTRRQPRFSCTCIICGSDFVGVTPWATACGPSCRKERARLRAREAARAKRVPPKPRDCVQCGATYTSARQDVVTCSKECRRKHSRQLAQANSRKCELPGCDNPHIARGLCRSHYYKTYPTKRRTVTEPCVVCGKPSTRVDDGPKRAAKYLPCCSYRCRTIVGNGWRTDLPADHWARWYGATSHWTPPQPKPIRFVSAQCAECGKWFIGDRQQSYGLAQDSRPHCSKKCLAKRHRDQRRARKRGAYVADVVRHKVYEADGWRCHICGKKVKRKAQVPDPMAPTIDHVIPLAEGGTHEPANCRTAHFICNSMKNSRGGGEQMLLVAV